MNEDEWNEEYFGGFYSDDDDDDDWKLDECGFMPGHGCLLVESRIL